MANKRDEYYFDNFISCSALVYKTAEFLKTTIEEFTPETLGRRIDEIHALEQEADALNHEMLSKLAKEFITPIERDDIMTLSRNIDDITDCVEDVLIHIYMNNVRAMRPDAAEFARLLAECCREVEAMMVEFRNFKKSKTILDHIKTINHIEEEGDQMYIKAKRGLHAGTSDTLTILCWNDIYDCLEKCFDACEHAADTVGSTVIANT